MIVLGTFRRLMSVVLFSCVVMQTAQSGDNYWFWNKIAYDEGWVQGYNLGAAIKPDDMALGVAVGGAVMLALSCLLDAAAKEATDNARDILVITTFLGNELKKLEQVCSGEILLEYSSMIEYVRAHDLLVAKNVKKQAENLLVETELRDVLDAIKNVVAHTINHQPACESLAMFKRDLYNKVMHLYAVLNGKLYYSNDLHQVVAKTLKLDVDTLFFLQS